MAPAAAGSAAPAGERMTKLGMHRVDGRSFWFGGYFNPFDRALMVRHAGEARADRFRETFGGAIPLAGARIVKVFDPDPAAAAAFGETFGVPAARSPDEFAEGLDGVIVPFPAGGPARDYGAVAPLARRGLPLFLDRLILEQAGALEALCAEAAGRRTPLHVSSFVRYVAPLLLPAPGARAARVTASAGGDPCGYGADLMDLVDELMGELPEAWSSEARSDGVRAARIRYGAGRAAELRLAPGAKDPMTVTAEGAGWSRTVVMDGSQNHAAAFAQFRAFLDALRSREPPVPYARVLACARILREMEQGPFFSGCTPRDAVAECTQAAGVRLPPRREPRT